MIANSQSAMRKRTRPRTILSRGAAPWLHVGSCFLATIITFRKGTIFFPPIKKTHKQIRHRWHLQHKSEPAKINPNSNVSVGLLDYVIINLRSLSDLSLSVRKWEQGGISNLTFFFAQSVIRCGRKEKILMHEDGSSPKCQGALPLKWNLNYLDTSASS